MPILSYILTALAAYLLGSIPSGYLVGKAKGVDIRTVGSKNMGATNVFRTVGKTLGILVLLADAFKGWAAVQLVLSPWILKTLSPDVTNPSLAIVAGIFAVLGHNYTCWLKFKGGKGIATSAGVYLALAPLAMGIAVAAFIVAVLATRYVSVGSIIAAIALPTAVWFTRESMLLRIVTIVLGALATYKHQANIQRLIAGTEHQINFKKKETPK